MISADQYLFPKNLEVTPSAIRRVLFIGSCMSDDYIKRFSRIHPNIEFEQLLFNHVSKLPVHASRPVHEYDLQVIQLPIRNIIGDRIIRFNEFVDDNDTMVQDAIQLLKIMLDEALAYNTQHNILTFVSNFIVPQGDFVAGAQNYGGRFDLRSLVIRLNQELSAKLAGRSNVYLLDVESIAGAIGKRYFLDDLLSFSTHGGFWFPDWNIIEGDRLEKATEIEEISPSHLTQYVDAVWRRIECIWRISNQVDQVKLVIFDLDDTMWRGIIGEHYGDEIQRITAGWPHGVQEVVHHLKSRGILTAVCSKNSRDVVEERWDRAVSEGFVTLDDFTFVEIDWAPKVEAIGRIIAAANLTPKSVVFVDDNPVERQSVLAAFPGIRVLSAQPFETKRILLNAPETQIALLTEETRQREKSVQLIKVREEARHNMSREEFLSSLGCSIEIFLLSSKTDPRFARALELLNKTNQFNTTGERWTFEAASSFLAKGGEVWCFNVSDRYTSYGLVGVIMLKDNEFTQFVMSCRVLGLDVETSVLRSILNQKISQVQKPLPFSAVMKITKQNAPCRTVYDKLGFVRETHNLEKLHVLLKKPLSVAPHLTIKMAAMTPEQSCPAKPLTQFMIERAPNKIARMFILREIERLRALEFDVEFYLNVHSDVAASGVDPIDHFVRFGRREGRKFRVGKEQP